MEDNENQLQRIEPRQCEIVDLDDGEIPIQCSQTAYWQYDGTVVCLDDMKAMAPMSSDNEEAFVVALASMSAQIEKAGSRGAN